MYGALNTYPLSTVDVFMYTKPHAIYPFPYLPSFCSIFFQSSSPTSFQQPLSITFEHTTAAIRHIIDMDDHEYTKKSDATNARIKRKCIMQQKRHTYFQSSIQPTIHPTRQNQLYPNAILCSTNLDINRSITAHHLAPATEDQSKKLNMPFRINYELTLVN